MTLTGRHVVWRAAAVGALCAAALRPTMAAAQDSAGSTTVRPAAAQRVAPPQQEDSAAVALSRAVKLYDDLQVERAVALLRQLVAPGSSYGATPAQRAEAYKFMGASLAILGARDSSLAAFQEAIERDPFVDLDPESFTAAERALFAEARRATFRVAAHPVRRLTLDPRTERLPLGVVATHQASLRVELRGAGGRAAVLYDGEADGVRDLAWTGVLGDGRLAPPGRYELLVAGTSRLDGRADTARLYLDVRHDVEPLEDTLPALRAAELLPEWHPRSAAARSLLVGVAVAAASVAIPAIVANGDLRGGGGALPAVAASAGVAAGALAFGVRASHRDIPENVAENARRRAERAARNADIAARNERRLARTKLLVSPAAGVGQ